MSKALIQITILPQLVVKCVSPKVQMWTFFLAKQPEQVLLAPPASLDA